MGRRIKIIAILEPEDAGQPAAPTSTVGFLVQGTDGQALMETLHQLCSGQPLLGDSAKRVRVTLHDTDESEDEQHLSPREREVLCGLVKGLSYKMIARELDISFETVRSHIKGIYLKMNVSNNTAAVAKAIHSGLAAA